MQCKKWTFSIYTLIFSLSICRYSGKIWIFILDLRVSLIFEFDEQFLCSYIRRNKDTLVSEYSIVLGYEIRMHDCISSNRICGPKVIQQMFVGSNPTLENNFHCEIIAYLLFFTVRLNKYKWNQPWHRPSQYTTIISICLFISKWKTKSRNLDN